MKFKRIVPWIVPIVLLGSWQLFSSIGLLSSRVLPNPIDIFTAAVELTKSGQLDQTFGSVQKEHFGGLL